MSSSVDFNYINAMTMATQIYMQLEETGNHDAYIILDKEQYRNVWKISLSDEKVHIYVSNSREVSILVLKILYENFAQKKSISGIIAIVDKAFDLNNAEENRNPHLIETDYFDFDMVLYESDVFTKFYHSYCTDSKIKELISVESPNLIEELKKFVLKKLNKLSFINLLNFQKNYNLTLNPSFNFTKYINPTNLDIDEKTLLENLASPTVTIDIQNKIKEMSNLVAENNPKNLCPGEWTFNLLSFGVNTIFTNRSKDCIFLPTDVKSLFYSGIEIRFLEKYKFFNKIRNWEATNKHRIFRSIELIKVDDHLLSFLIECSKDPGVKSRSEGDSQLSQLATFLAGSRTPNLSRKIAIVDVGAGFGDLVRAIKKSGGQELFIYYPIEINIKRHKLIIENCNGLPDFEYKPVLTNIQEIDIKKADRVFFINMLHELDLENRVANLQKSLELTRKWGLIS